MASGRASPLRAFKQPASPKMESSSSKRLRASRQPSTQGGPLRLPGLPRFHPANFPSSHSSMTSTPASGVNSPQVPMSPRAQQRLYSDAQRQLLTNQRGLGSLSQKPSSPKLMPLAGSPGPVTPLELEADSYLTAGSGHTSLAAQTDYVERVIREQATRRAETSARNGRLPSGSY